MLELLVITSFPENGLLHGSKTVGVASYAKNTLLAILKKDSDIKINIFAEILDKAESYVDSNMQVTRNWKRKNLLSIFKMFVSVLRHPSKNVLLQFEMFMFGGFSHALLGVLMTVFARCLGKDITLVLHQVVSEVEVFEKNKLKGLFFKLSRKIFYNLVLLSASRIVVFEQELKDRLGRGDKILVIPHAVEQKAPLNKQDAKKALKLSPEKSYILYFGFLSPYKGVDVLLENWENKNGYQLILAGGPNPNHENDPEYQAFINKTFELARQKDVIAPGFVKQEEIELYFSAADLVVLPYLLFMSSSGPMALAFTYEVGVMLSQPLGVYFNTQDMSDSLTEVGLTVDDVTFPLNRELSSRIYSALENPATLKSFSQKVKAYRSWDYIGGLYYSSIFHYH